MINYSLIANAMRQRVIAAAEIEPLTQYQADNHIFDPANKSFWIAEYVIGGTETTITPNRSRIPAFLIQYDLFVPVNSGMEELDAKAQAICADFNLADPEQNTVHVANLSVFVKSIKQESDTQKFWKRRTLLFTLDIVTG